MKRFKWCGSLDCWIDRVLFVTNWGAYCPLGHRGCSEFAAGDWP